MTSRPPPDPPAPSVPAPDGNSLFERVGGAAGVRAVVAVFYRRVLADPELAGYFAGVDLARLESHQRWFLAAAWGGPDGFTGRDLAAAHAGLAVTDAAFTGLVDHLATTLSDLGVPAADVAAVGTALEGLRPAVVSAPMGCDEAEDGEHGPGDADDRRW